MRCVDDEREREREREGEHFKTTLFVTHLCSETVVVISNVVCSSDYKYWQWLSSSFNRDSFFILFVDFSVLLLVSVVLSVLLLCSFVSDNIYVDRIKLYRYTHLMEFTRKYLLTEIEREMFSKQQLKINKTKQKKCQLHQITKLSFHHVEGCTRPVLCYAYFTFSCCFISM